MDYINFTLTKANLDLIETRRNSYRNEIHEFTLKFNSIDKIISSIIFDSVDLSKFKDNPKFRNKKLFSKNFK